MDLKEKILKTIENSRNNIAFEESYPPNVREQDKIEFNKTRIRILNDLMTSDDCGLLE